jgi:hypothetical protein
MRFWAQQLILLGAGVTVDGAMLAAGWDRSLSMQDLSAKPFDDFLFLSNWFVDMTRAAFVIRTIMWLAWDTSRGDKLLRFCGFPRALVLNGPFSGMLQWWFHIDSTGKDRDA